MMLYLKIPAAVRSDSVMGNKKKAFAAAFPYTVPVMAGFLFLGIAYGVLMSAKGYGIAWTLLISTFVFAGAMQFAGVALLTSAFNPLYALLLTIMVNGRHLFYGVSMLNKFKDAGRLKPYLIFGMCDETFSILCSVEPPEDIDSKWFMFFVTLLGHSYWVAGSSIGSLLGYMIGMSALGLDFVLTSLFTVIFLNQWKDNKVKVPGLTGLGATALCLFIFGPKAFILPSLLIILGILAVFRNPIERLTIKSQDLK